MTSPATDELQHLSQWDETLWGLVDATLEPAQQASAQRHLESCDCCRQHLTRLYALDRRLRLSVPRLKLGSAFDEKLLAQLPPLDTPENGTRLCRERTSGWRSWRALLGNR